MLVLPLLAVCGEASRSILWSRERVPERKLPKGKKCWPEQFIAGICDYAMASMTKSTLLSKGAVALAMGPK